MTARKVTDAAAPEATPGAEAAPATPQIDTSALFEFLQGMDAKIDAQGQQLAAQAAEIERLRTRPAQAPVSGPQILPMDPTQQPLNGAQVSYRQDGGQNFDNERVIPSGVDSHELPEQVQLTFPQRFQPGDRVVIRRDVTREDCPKSWGDILDSIGVIRCSLPNPRFKHGCPGKVEPGGTCPVCRTGPHVKKVMFLNPQGQWCYKVWIAGLTGRLGQALYDRELAAAPGTEQAYAEAAWGANA